MCVAEISLFKCRLKGNLRGIAWVLFNILHVMWLYNVWVSLQEFSFLLSEHPSFNFHDMCLKVSFPKIYLKRQKSHLFLLRTVFTLFTTFNWVNCHRHWHGTMTLYRLIFHSSYQSSDWKLWIYFLRWVNMWVFGFNLIIFDWEAFIKYV